MRYAMRQSPVRRERWRMASASAGSRQRRPYASLASSTVAELDSSTVNRPSDRRSRPLEHRTNVETLTGGRRDQTSSVVRPDGHQVDSRRRGLGWLIPSKRYSLRRPGRPAARSRTRPFCRRDLETIPQPPRMPDIDQRLPSPILHTRVHRLSGGSAVNASIASRLFGKSTSVGAVAEGVMLFGATVTTPGPATMSGRRT